MPQAHTCRVNELDSLNSTPKSGGRLCQHVVLQWGPVKMKQTTTSYVLGKATWKQSSVERRWTSRSNKFSIFARLTLFYMFFWSCGSFASCGEGSLLTIYMIGRHLLWWAGADRDYHALICLVKKRIESGSMSTGSIASHPNFFLISFYLRQIRIHICLFKDMVLYVNILMLS